MRQVTGRAGKPRACAFVVGWELRATTSSSRLLKTTGFVFFTCPSPTRRAAPPLSLITCTTRTQTWKIRLEACYSRHWLTEVCRLGFACRQITCALPQLWKRSDSDRSAGVASSFQMCFLTEFQKDQFISPRNEREYAVDLLSAAAVSRHAGAGPGGAHETVTCSAGNELDGSRQAILIFSPLMARSRF